MKILVATHKPTEFPVDEGYVPFQNGKLSSSLDLGMLNDGNGLNISEKMPFYSECCALYWLVNNLDDELVGLMHYRRYFAPLSKSVVIDDQYIAASDDFEEMKVADLIVCDERDLSPQTVWEQYSECHFAQDLTRTRLVLDRLQPSYVDAYDSVMNGSTVTLYNIFVGKRATIKHYVDWLFPILFSLEEIIPFKEYGFYQERVFSFLAERLFTVWLLSNNRTFKFARRPMVFLSH